jgi:hypothetical protein
MLHTADVALLLVISLCWHRRLCCSGAWRSSLLLLLLLLLRCLHSSTGV